MSTPKHKGPPLLPTEAGGVVVGSTRPPKFREVASDSRSSSPNSNIPSRRHPTPLLSRTSPATPQPPPSAAVKRPQTPAPPSALVKRSDRPEQRWPNKPATSGASKLSPSTERKRPSTPGDSGERHSGAGKLLGSLSRKSLSFSYQGEAFSAPTSKTKPAPAPPPTSQVGSVIRRGTPERRKREAENSKSMIDQRRLWPGFGEVRNSLTRSSTDLKQSGVEDVSSDTASIYSENDGYVQERGSARSWQETTIKPNNNGVNPLAPLKINAGGATNKLVIDSSSPISTPEGSSSSKGSFSPFRPAPPRRMPSPSRARNVLNNDYLSNSSRTILGFGDEVRRGGENRNVTNAHMLRVMYNGYLQWRFLNARADVEIGYKKITAEKSLYNTWVTTLKLRRSVASKRAEVQLLQQNLKLHSILNGQMLYLNDWGLIDGDNSSSLSGAIEALESSTLRLPLVGGARAKIQNVKDAICSAVDVMQVMASSIGSLLPKVNKVNSLVCELARVTSKERVFLEQCEDLLSILTNMQVGEWSMRTHILQLSSEASSQITRAKQADLIGR